MLALPRSLILNAATYMAMHLLRACQRGVMQIKMLIVVSSRDESKLAYAPAYLSEC